MSIDQTGICNVSSSYSGIEASSHQREHESGDDASSTTKTTRGNSIDLISTFIREKKETILVSVGGKMTATSSIENKKSFLNSILDNSKIKKTINKIKRRKINKEKIGNSIKHLLQSVLNYTKSHIKSLLLWILWLYIGTMFYAHVDFDGSYCKGFYFSVNVGYSVGWGVLHETTQASYWFSTFYIIIGAIFLSAFIVNLIQSFFARDDWLDRLKQNNLIKLHQQNGSFPFLQRMKLYLEYHITSLLIIGTWFFYIFAGTIWSCHYIGWTVIEGIYFSVSSLSTGGLHGIPLTSPDWMFLW